MTADRDPPANPSLDEFQLRAIIDGVRDHAISLLDREGRILTWNATAERLKGYSLAEVRGQYFGMLFTEEDRAAGLPAHELEVAAREGHWRGEGWRQRKDGTRFPASVSVSALRDANGSVTGFVKVTQDISERRRMEEALRVSEARLATTLHSIGDAVIATDPNGLVTFMNPVAESLTRWSAAEAAGRPLAEVFHIVNEYTRRTVESPVDKVLREGVIVGLANHTALIARDGSETSIADSGAPIRGSDGAIAGVVLVFRDVTEERREHERERLLAEATAQLANSLDSESTLRDLAGLVVPRMADWCVIELFDAAGVLQPLEIVHADPFKRETAQRVVEGAGNRFSRVARTGRGELQSEVSDAVVESWAHDADQLHALRAVGIKSYASAPLTTRGRVLGVLTLVAGPSRERYGPADLGFVEELARRAALALDNARLYRAAQEAAQTRDEFLATVSHELRTPLTAMLGWTRMLRTGSVAEEKREHALEVIERNATAQVRLVEDLLDVSRIVSGKLVLHPTPVVLADIADLAVEAVRPAATAKGVRIVMSLDAGAGSVLGDRDRLQQVAWNLLNNAVKFTPRGGEVSVVVRRVEGQVELRVSDTGKGITPEFLPHVFERFRQADSSHNRAHGGLGLGLAIVRHLVELHGGSVYAESPGEGRGAIFGIRLPVAREDSASVDVTKALEEPAIDASLAGSRVLVVDDDADTRDMLATALRAAGAIVETAEGAEPALAAVRREPPDAIVSDIGMPGDDGYALIRSIRALSPQQGGATPAIALTAYTRTEDRAHALSAGFDRHLAKPIEPRDLVIAVARAMRRSPTQ